MRNLTYQIVALCFCFSLKIYAQTSGQNAFISELDDSLNIRSVALLPATDNVNQVYAKSANAVLKSLLIKDSQWSLVKTSDNDVSTSEVIASSQSITSWLKSKDADAALYAHITKGTMGISLSLSLYAQKSGSLVLFDEIRSNKIFETEEVEKLVASLFNSLKNKLPYRGLVLSRRGQEVTINLGKSSGLRVNDSVSVVQIIKADRHPVKNFIVSSEKETLGKVKLFKVSENMSFGNILFERESGVIRKNSKVIPESYISYQDPASVTNSPLSEVSYGKDAKEWRPEDPPQYGKIALFGGFSQYINTQTLFSSGSIAAKNDLAPNLSVRGELWLSQEYFVSYLFRQGIFSVNNPLPGSSPSAINMTLNQYGLMFGYNFLLSQDFLGPRLQLSAGLRNSSFTSASSEPLALTTMNYSGFLISLGGQFPAFDSTDTNLGAKFDLYVSSSLNENIKSAASNSTQINAFSVYIEYVKSVKTHYIFELQLENYNSSMSGSGNRTENATNISNKATTLSFGIEKLF